MSERYISSERRPSIDAQPHDTRCPYCRSSDIAVPAKLSPSSYSRCESCGQMWHPDRLPVGFTPRR